MIKCMCVRFYSFPSILFSQNIFHRQRNFIGFGPANETVHTEWAAFALCILQQRKKYKILRLRNIILLGPCVCAPGSIIVATAAIRSPTLRRNSFDTTETMGKRL